MTKESLLRQFGSEEAISKHFSAISKMRSKKPATHCKRGHEFTEENTTYLARGGRSCRACARQRTGVSRKGED